MALSAGSRLGPYVITAPIGVGGMGEVYRATDTSLKRAVAIKVLPESVASDVDRMARFLREAEVLASLNHSNIAAIYGLERSTGTAALVMELVEGPTLADRIARGPIPVGEALVIARQIAEALESAHGQGLIHRDLKPANIKVRPDGMVKVLDFGLAKVLRSPFAGGLRSSDEVSEASTVAPTSLTETGMILGTASYMSPEQAQGQSVDPRADIWAFGCVLYEMLTGRRAFRGANVPDILAAVLRDQPAWERLPADLPPAVRVYVRRCLAKDPRQRVQAIGDVRLAIEGAFETTAARTAVTAIDGVDLPPGVDAGAYTGAPGMRAPIASGTSVPARDWGSIAVTAASIVLGGFVVVTGLGFVASRTLDVGLGRSGGFAPAESVLAWTRWGLMQLTAPVVLILAPLLIAAVVVNVLYRAVTRIPPVKSAWGPVKRLGSQTSAKVRALPAGSLGEAILLTQLVTLVWFVWWFRPVFLGLADFTFAPLPGDLSELRPTNFSAHERWRQLLSLQLMVFGSAWYWLMSTRRARQEIGGRTTLAGGAALLMLTAFLFAMPFRVFFHAELERVLLRDERCYETARQPAEVLVFCPGRSERRSSAVAAGDPALARTGIIESVFAVFDDTTPAPVDP